MSMKYLGEAFDLHTGAVDNIFPHHENEIAQSEAATGVPFVKYWLHCAHLIVDGKKMSKSAGNFFTLRDLLARGLQARAIRYLLQSVHYRKPLNFTLEGVEQARAALDRLDAFRHRLEHEPAPEGRSALADQVAAAQARFDAALDDDLNSAEALGVLFELIREANSAYDRGEVRAADCEPLIALLDEVDAVFGLATGPSGLLDADVEALLRERQAAREARDFARADALRDTLAGRGIVLEDTPHGMRWRRR
jgi:cysteinyl-tRNA synthetase